MVNELTITHPQLVRVLKKSSAAIVQCLLHEDTADLLHMAVGVSGEAGELLDAVKKRAIYGHVLNRENVIEELGDIEFYLEGLRQRLNITREECLVANIRKLSQRYEGLQYSDTAAKERKDKQ